MPVTVIVGGQYGSEGKGKVAHFFSKEQHATFAVRCGGPNSGHTVVDHHGQTHIFQHLPTAAVLPDVKLMLCAGSYIDVDILFSEIKSTNIAPERLMIDPDAVLITEEMKRIEQDNGLIDKIGSTGSGTGAAVSARINRINSVKRAKDDERLLQFLTDIPNKLRFALADGSRVLIEGTQGFGLSPLHSRLFPHVTSRDTTAAAFLSEVGLSPFDVDEIVLVLRAFPIRVAGNSGPLPNETTWEAITTQGNHTMPIVEYTSVTKKIRRVAQFCPEIVKRAILVNRPTTIVLNHLDYLANKCDNKHLIIKKFLKIVESKIKHEISHVGLGPDAIYPVEILDNYQG